MRLCSFCRSLSTPLRHFFCCRALLDFTLTLRPLLSGRAVILEHSDLTQNGDCGVQSRSADSNSVMGAAPAQRTGTCVD